MHKVATARSRHVSPGDKLGKYEVIRQIAVGGMAELYLARTSGIEGFEKLVVIKRILPQYATSSSFVEMFLNEARLAATLQHANVAQVYDIGVDDGDYFFAMEYVHGEDLDHIAVAAEEQGVPLSIDAALTLVAGLCAGLHYAHERLGPDGKPLGIVHRDISPSNVLVSYDGSIKLVDFGIARASSRPGTTQGGLKGKIAYMSPEQCRAKADLDRRSDIYAVGTILYQLTTGRMPFEGETEYQILNQIVNDDPPAPSTVVAEYPKQLEQIVMRALARDPANRYSTAQELQAAVEDFAHESRLRISPLVLARLMGTLFPARLEEWDQAKTRGPKFLEQQVVRTLIESGRTPARGEETVRSQRAPSSGEDETTVDAQISQISQTSQMQYLDNTGTNMSPISTVEDSHVGTAPSAASTTSAAAHTKSSASAASSFAVPTTKLQVAKPPPSVRDAKAPASERDAKAPASARYANPPTDFHQALTPPPGPDVNPSTDFHQALTPPPALQARPSSAAGELPPTAPRAIPSGAAEELQPTAPRTIPSMAPDELPPTAPRTIPSTSPDELPPTAPRAIPSTPVASPIPRTPVPSAIPRTPVPHGIPTTPPPGMYPVLSGGTLVSSSGVGPSLAVAQAKGGAQYEVTEQVRALPLAPSPTTRRSSTWLVLGGAAIIGCGLAVFLAVRGETDAPRPEPAITSPGRANEPPARAVSPPAVAPASPPEAVPASPPEVAPESPPVVAPGEPPTERPVDHGSTTAEQPVDHGSTTAEKPAPKPTKPVVKRPKPKAKPDAKPGYNADSPFMPVRTENKK